MTYQQYHDFIRIWYESTTIVQVAAATGLDRRACSNLAAHLRRKGVLLPPMPKQSKFGKIHISEEQYDQLRRWATACSIAKNVNTHYRYPNPTIHPEDTHAASRQETEPNPEEWPDPDQQCA